MSASRETLLRRRRASTCRRAAGPCACEECRGHRPPAPEPHPATEMQDVLGNRGLLRQLHAVRQETPERLPETASPLSHTDASGVRLRWGPASEALARRMGAVAFTVGDDVFMDTARFPPGTPDGDFVLRHELGHVAEQRGRTPELALLTEAQFRARLGASQEQAVVVEALFVNPTFRALWDYLGGCGATPAQDLGPIRLVVTPGLRSGGVERFGAYDPFTRTLEINPTKPEHLTNPQEQVDTIVHEVIHAVDDVSAACIAAGSPAPPFPGAQTIPRVPGLPALGPTEAGPSASNPCEESIDISVQAQDIVTQVIRENLQTTRIGMPTIAFVNDLLRSSATARAQYSSCRAVACALAPGRARDRAIGQCGLLVLGTEMPGQLLPSRVLFDFNSSAIRAGAAAALELTAIFLQQHPETHVILEGHADPVGDPDFNLRLGLKRAQAVEAFLLAHGAPAAQIDEVTTRGEEVPISTKPSEHFQDRRVEIIPLSRVP